MNDWLLADARNARLQLGSGALRGEALARRILALPARERDAWANELLGLAEPPPDAASLPDGAVPYWPAGIDEILTMVREVPLHADDELVDLGSGLGRVVILAHLLSGARARGVEIQEPLVLRAQECCVGLGIRGVSFVCADAADAPLDGSVFFLYSPFNGETLKRVLRSLEGVARRRPIVLCAVGLELPGQPWLVGRTTSSAMLTLYDSRAPGA